jgi:hypothetical protein
MQGSVLAACLFVAYLTVWQPVRTVMLTGGANPVLQRVALGNADASVRLNRSAQVLRIQYGPERSDRTSVPAPAGVPFLLPALFLCILAPRRPVWLFFLLGHVGMSGLVVISWTVALQGSGVSIHVAQALGSYGIDAYSLMIPALVWARESGLVEQLEERGGDS